MKKKKIDHDTNGESNVPDTKTVPFLRYSDEELEEFKQIIEKKLTAARKEYDYHLSFLVGNNDHMHDSSSYNHASEPDAAIEKEEHARIASRQNQLIKNLENALVRINNKTYGVCRVTGKLIPKERLRVVPHTTTTIEGKGIEKSKTASVPE